MLPLKQFTLSDEGYALDLSRQKIGRIACGLNDGQIYVYDPTDVNFNDIVHSASFKPTKHSIEDL